LTVTGGSGLFGRARNQVYDGSIVTNGALQSIVRHRLLEAVDRCKAVPRLPAFKRPPEKIASGSLFAHLEDDDGFAVDVVGEYPWALQSRDLIYLWWDGIPSSVLSFSTLRLGGRTWLYFQRTDSEEDFLYFLAVAETNSAQDTHEQFMTELFRSNGETLEQSFL
jgi:hypothetical protein